MRFHDGGSGGFDQRRLSFHSKLRSVFEAAIQELILGGDAWQSFQVYRRVLVRSGFSNLRTWRRVDPRGNPHGWSPGTAEGEKNY
jgi:hypothetical protein